MPIDPENGDGHVEEFDESEGFDPEDLVTITDDDGVSLECAILAIIEHDGAEYALLAPVAQLQDDDGEEVEMFIFTYEVEEDGTQKFSFVEDDETYEAVRQEFSVLMDQE